jgi:hypothetical protein
MTLEALKAEISKLPPDWRRELADWLTALDEEGWDREIEADFSPGGRGTDLLDKIRQEIADGKAGSLENGLSEFRERR